VIYIISIETQATSCDQMFSENRHYITTSQFKVVQGKQKIKNTWKKFISTIL